MTGLLFELGPCRVTSGGQGTELNPHSWNSRSNIIFLDQPANVGFSHGGKGVSNSNVAAEDAYVFLQLFLESFKKYSNLPFVVTGESYAGHYIPAIANQIQTQNLQLKQSNPHQLANINLVSIAIGNGLTDPAVQYEYYPDMACDTKYGPVLSDEQCDEMRGI